MDPQATARTMVSYARMLLEQYDRDEDLDPDDVGELAQAVLSFAEWRSKGGFAPDWAAALSGE
jgi:hypothetical protein